MPSSSSSHHRSSKSNKPPHRKDAAAAARALQALQLRKEGCTYEQIAQQCGYRSRSGAYDAVQRELQRTMQEPADDVRQLEVMRLDDLYRAMIPKALKGDTWSVDRCLKIMERRAALLGLDVKVENAGSVPLIVEIPAPIAQALRGQTATSSSFMAESTYAG